MQLRIISLGQAAIEQDDVAALRAADASGSFGIRPGFADFLTVLDVGVISWRDSAGHERHCALRRGLLRVSGGARIDIASREAIVDDDLARLESTVLAAFRQRDDAERRSRTENQRMELQVLREFGRYLQPGAAAGRARP